PSASADEDIQVNVAWRKIVVSIIGARPMKQQQPTSTAMDPTMLAGASCACSACFDRAVPRNTEPYTLTKHARARAPINASSGAAKLADAPSVACTARNKPR